MKKHLSPINCSILRNTLNEMNLTEIKEGFIIKAKNESEILSKINKINKKEGLWWKALKKHKSTKDTEYGFIQMYHRRSTGTYAGSFNIILKGNNEYLITVLDENFKIKNSEYSS